MRHVRRRAHRAKNLVGFTLGAVEYALDIACVREIVHPLATVPVPHAPGPVDGVADHRGEVVPVVDLRRYLGVDSATGRPRTKWIVVQTSRGLAALVVDRVTDVFGAKNEELRTPPAAGSEPAARSIVAVCSHDGNLVLVLDVEKLLAPIEAFGLAPRLPFETTS